LFSFFTIWFFLSFGSLPLTVPRKCLVYLLHYSFTFVMRISHHRQIWPTHRYAIISSCSFLSVTSSAPTKKHFEFRVWSLRQMLPSLFHWPDRNFRHYKKSTNERISIFCFFLLFWFFLSTRRRYMSHTEPNEMRVRRSKQPPAGEETRAVCREPCVCGIRFDIQDSDERKEEEENTHLTSTHLYVEEERSTWHARHGSALALVLVYIYTCRRHCCWLAGRGLTMGSSHALFLVVGGLEILFFSLAGAILILSKSIKAHGWREE
jgi:hypothetical protein